MLRPIPDKTHALPDPAPGSSVAGIAIMLTVALARYAAIGLTVWMLLS